MWRGVSGAMGQSPNSSFVTQMRTTEACEISASDDWMFKIVSDLG